MTPAPQSQPSRTSDLGYLGIPPDMLPPDGPSPNRLSAPPGGDLVGSAAADPSPVGLRFTLADDGEALPDPLTLAREVRAGLEEALALLIAALPADQRGPARHAALRAD